MPNIQLDGDNFVATIRFEENWRIKSAPWVSWDRKHKHWKLPVTKANSYFLTQNFGEESFSEIARETADHTLKDKLVREPFPDEHEYIFPPMGHQEKVLDMAWSLDKFALFHDMGCGKTYVAIQLAVARLLRNLIDSVVVVCPTSVKYIWPVQIQEHCSIDLECYVMEPGAKRVMDFIKLPGPPKVMIVGIESLSQGKAYTHVDHFMRHHNAPMMIVDESSRIKNGQRIRSEKVTELGTHAAFRLIMTGTSITQGLQDLYSQFRFLDPKIIGSKTYTSFRNRYCIMGGFEGKSIIGYDNTKELFALVRPYVDVVRKKDVLDLPPTVWEKRVVQPTSEIKKAMKELKDFMKTENDEGHVITVTTALDRMLRYQQLAGGFYPYVVETEVPDPDPDAEPGATIIEKKWHSRPLNTNPKLTELLQVIEETSEKVIIWARFVNEIEAITEALEKKIPGSVQTFYGATKDRPQAIKRFRTDPQCRFFVSNQAVGGLGLTLIEATLTFYYSNTFSHEDRVQSRDRNYRKGQTVSCTYIDLFMDTPIDRLIEKALATKMNMATMVESALREEPIEDTQAELEEFF